jgi:hypothetical protein
LTTHLRLGLPSALFSSAIPTNILYAFLFSPFVLHFRPSHPTWLDHSNYVWRSVQVMQLLIMQFYFYISEIIWGRAIAEAVSPWLPTAAARVRARVRQVEFLVHKVASG